MACTTQVNNLDLRAWLILQVRMHVRLFARSCNKIVHIRMQILHYESARIPPSVGTDGVIRNLVTRIRWFLITRIVHDLTRTYNQISTGSFFARKQTIRKSIAIDFARNSNEMIPRSNRLQWFRWKPINFNRFRREIARNDLKEKSVAMISFGNNRFQSISMLEINQIDCYIQRKFFSLVSQTSFQHRNLWKKI